MSRVYLYKFKDYVQLSQTLATVPNINLPMITYNTKLYKGVTNTIDFSIRNNDRKPINIVGYMLRAQIRRVNTVTNAKAPPDIILEKNLVIVDECKGKAKLVLEPGETEHWDPGAYFYTIKTINQDNQAEVLYFDINKDSIGSFELLEGLASSLIPAIEILGKKFTTEPVSWDFNTKYVTSAFPGDAQEMRAAGTHTIIAYTTRWTGKFWIEGSLTNEAPLPSEWFRIPLSAEHEYFEFIDDTNTAPKLFNFTMNLYWIRFIYEPAAQNTGTFDKILYKN